MVSKAPLFFKLHGAGAWDVPKAFGWLPLQGFSAVRTALHWPIEIAACNEAWSQALPAMLGHSAMLGHGAIVQSIDDPLQAAVSPFPGNTCQNATRVPEQLDGDLRLAFAISHADLPRADSLQQLVSQVRPSEGWAFREVVEDAPIASFQELGGWWNKAHEFLCCKHFNSQSYAFYQLALFPSCFQPSLALWPTKAFKAGQLVFSEDGLQWNTGGHMSSREDTVEDVDRTQRAFSSKSWPQLFRVGIHSYPNMKIPSYWWLFAAQTVVSFTFLFVS